MMLIVTYCVDRQINDKYTDFLIKKYDVPGTKPSGICSPRSED